LHLFGNILTFRPGRPGARLSCSDAVGPGRGRPPNRHPGDDEAFYILSGRYEFSVDGVTRSSGR
jgi:mannose-6-phosphate isomerase-like protein (cupin superfamily)